MTTPKRNTTAELFLRMPASEYDRAIGMRSTLLKKMLDSPAHFHQAQMHPDPIDSPAMIFGRLMHCMALTPHEFSSEFYVFNGPRRAGKDWEAAKLAAGGKTIIKPSDLELATMIGNAVRDSDQVRRSPYGDLIKFDPEVSGFWSDQETEIPCKYRMDLTNAAQVGKVPGSTVVIADIKTTVSARPDKFQRQAYSLGYHVSAAHYVAGLREYFREPVSPRFVIIAVEKDPPHVVQVFEMSAGLLHLGEHQRRTALNLLRQCVATNHWPGYFSQALTLDAPAWAYSNED